MKCVIYLRVSTKKQGSTGLGLEAQRKLCLEWIKRNTASGIKTETLEFVEVHTGTDKDDCALEKREVLMEALSVLEKGDYFIVSSRDRLARDKYLLPMLERMIERKKSKLVAANGNNGDRPEDVLQRLMVDAFAMYEGLIISQRTKRALAAKKATGQRSAGRIPYGKRVGVANKLIFNHEEIKVLKRMQQLRKDGVSFRNMATQLNNEGYTNRGNPWHYSAVKRVYQNETP